MSEFTGERVIPGEVNDDLWAEHVARYAFAARFASHKKALDLGCGTGYGTALLAHAASSTVGVDLAPEAIAYALSHYSSAEFLQCSAVAVPFPPASFDLVTAFELIEHLPDWRALLAEARRVLRPDGLLIISTPNQRYYAETRAKAGPNPFHVHEFEYGEFRSALGAFFPHVQVLFQDRVEAFAFYDGAQAPGTEADIGGHAGDPHTANFFIGLCSCAPLPPLAAFLYAPRAANLLREREEHIRLLERELTQVRLWLEQTTTDRNSLLAAHSELQTQSETAQARAAQIIADLNQENQRKTQWAIDTEQRLTAELAKHTARLAEAVRLLDRAEATVIERTDWARGLETQLQATAAQLAMIRQSRWLRLGRQLGLGPHVAKIDQEATK
ncbi:MAG TPA: class I SAM-dependent methyltransferase [Bryobacteraceae bacterium]|nr:class I SAM-dependent methyltransferase [Bryobacteraceae bacterium]